MPEVKDSQSYPQEPCLSDEAGLSIQGECDKLERRKATLLRETATLSTDEILYQYKQLIVDYKQILDLTTQMPSTMPDEAPKEEITAERSWTTIINSYEQLKDRLRAYEEELIVKYPSDSTLEFPPDMPDDPPSSSTEENPEETPDNDMPDEPPDTPCSFHV